MEIVIESVQNPKVKEWTKLKQKKYRQQHQRFIVEGEHLVEEALAARAVEVIITTRSMLTADVPVYRVTEAILAKLTATPAHQDIMAICTMPQLSNVDGNRLLLLDTVQDPGNVGTLIRSALAFGIEAVVLGEGSVDIYNEKVLRATQGAIFHLPIVTKDLKIYIPTLQARGVAVIGTSFSHATNLSHLAIPHKWAILLGNEGQGVSEQLLQMTNENVYIEMNDQAESLNVGVAGSILMYTFSQKA
ncbi:MAG: TrmH family RNA methyltransferase [Culicoidibacterales bacterium]